MGLKKLVKKHTLGLAWVVPALTKGGNWGEDCGFRKESLGKGEKKNEMGWGRPKFWHDYDRVKNGLLSWKTKIVWSLNFPKWSTNKRLKQSGKEGGKKPGPPSHLRKPSHRMRKN